MIPGDLLSAFPHRQFHTLPGLLDSWAALPNSNPNACMPMQGGSLYHFYDGLWYDPAERRTHDLPCERRTRYRLSQPDTVLMFSVRPDHDTRLKPSTHSSERSIDFMMLLWCQSVKSLVESVSYQLSFELGICGVRIHYAIRWPTTASYEYKRANDNQVSDNHPAAQKGIHEFMLLFNEIGI